MSDTQIPAPHAPSPAGYVRPSKGAFWTGHIIGTLVALLLIASGVAKFFIDPPAATQPNQFSLSGSTLQIIAIIEISCALLFLIPQTAVLGAILIAAYMGGAVLAHVLQNDYVFTQVIIGMLPWVALLLREPRLRPLLPLRRF